MTDFEGRSKLVRSMGRAVNSAVKDVRPITMDIFSNPEPAGGEEQAVAAITGFLTNLGYKVETGIAGMPTAFRAHMYYHDREAMRKGLRHGHVGILAEYDAGPEGHLEGRHLVAGAAMTTAAALRRALVDLHGEVTIVGVPAAGTRQGMRTLHDAGIFEPLDVILGARPASTGWGFQPTLVGSGETLGRVVFGVTTDDAASVDRIVSAVEDGDHLLEEHDQLRADRDGSGVRITVASASIAGLRRMEDLVRELVGGDDVELTEIERIPVGNPNRILSRRMRTYADAAKLEQDRIIKSPPGEPDDWAWPAMVAGTTAARFPVSTEQVELGTEAFADASITDYALDQMVKAGSAVSVVALDCLGDLEFRGYVEGELIRGLTPQGIRREPRRWLGVHPVQEEVDTSSSNGVKPLGKLRRT
jgi:hypothetical protein